MRGLVYERCNLLGMYSPEVAGLFSPTEPLEDFVFPETDPYSSR
jgi:hypothetical protein